MMSVFFTEKDVVDFKSAVTSDTNLFGKYFQTMLSNGIYLAPSQFEALFISTAHSKEDLDKTIAANLKSLSKLLK
jgi:glutamate-1-semialdehyde 2,1-aminomutase